MLDEKTVMRLIRKHLPSGTARHLIVTDWKDGIDIDRPAFSTMEFVKAVAAVNNIDRLTAENAGLLAERDNLKAIVEYYAIADDGGKKARDLLAAIATSSLADADR